MPKTPEGRPDPHLNGLNLARNESMNTVTCNAGGMFGATMAGRHLMSRRDQGRWVCGGEDWRSASAGGASAAAPAAQTAELAAIKVCIVVGWKSTACSQSNGKTPAWNKITSKHTNRKQDGGCMREEVGGRSAADCRRDPASIAWAHQKRIRRNVAVQLVIFQWLLDVLLPKTQRQTSIKKKELPVKWSKNTCVLKYRS